MRHASQMDRQRHFTDVNRRREAAKPSTKYVPCKRCPVCHQRCEVRTQGRIVHNIVFIKEQEGERYVFSWRDEHRAELLRTFGRFAANPELSFTWYDAAIMSQRVRLEFAIAPAERSEG